MELFRALVALVFVVLSMLSFIGCVGLSLIAFGGGILTLSYISLNLFPLPIFVEMWLKAEWLWRVLEVSTATDEVKAGAVVVITLTVGLLLCLMWGVTLAARAAAAKLLDEPE